jgi:Tol biopolymer transport system component
MRRHPTAAVKAVLVVLVVVIAVFLSAVSGRAAAPSRIVFTADRAPSVSGEIYRLDRSGHRVDLSNSPFQDSGPVVSQDGRRVAFFSDRSGALSVWEVGIDGRGLVQVGPSLAPPDMSGSGQFTWWGDYIGCCSVPLAWQPHGSRLAVIDSPAGGGLPTLYILRQGAEPKKIFTGDVLENPGWSPDGKVLLAWDDLREGVARAFLPSGRRLWSIGGAEKWSWSPHGLLALSVRTGTGRRVTWSGLRVYDEQRQLRFAVHGSDPAAPGWSPDGHLLAALFDHKLEVLTAAGRLVLRTQISGTPDCRNVVWASETRVIVGGSLLLNDSKCRVVGIDIRSGSRSPASSLWFETRSPNGKLAAVASQHGDRMAIGVAKTDNGARTTYAHFQACRPGLSPLPVTFLQFAGRSRSLVYASYCPGPYTNLYSIAPDGSGLQRITSHADASQPALSPDGSRIAYAENKAIRVIAGSGGTPAALTTPPTCPTQVPPPYRPPASSPSWSPDGKTILFTQTECDVPDELYTVPTSGGSPHSLGLTGDQPAWGPSRIAYVWGGIWTANPDGTNPVQIATSGMDPAWSADGRLAYLTGTNNTTAVVDATQTQLPFTDVTSLAWSPDSSRFVVTARTFPTSPFDLYTVNTDGTDPTQLTHNYDALAASWR